MKFKRFTSLLVALLMVTSLLPLSVSAVTELNVTDNIIDITDKDIYSLSKYYARATNIQINGANVKSATEDGTTIDIVLNGCTDPNAEIGVEFGTALNSCKMSGHTGTVTLADGNAELSLTLKGEYASMSSMNKSVNYLLKFSLAELLTAPPERLVESDEKSTYNNVSAYLNLEDYFKDGQNYYLVSEGNKTPIDGNKYTFTSDIGGTFTLEFAASNINGECPDTVLVTIEVTEVKSALWIGNNAPSNGSFDYIKFTDSEGNDIEGINASLNENNITVILPRTIAPNGVIKTVYNVTQNGDLPFLTTQTGTSGTSSGKAVNNKFTEKNITLKNGVASFTFYLYDITPTNKNNVYTTYKIDFVLKNEVPTLKEGQASESSFEIFAEEIFSLDLTQIFTDKDEDTLTYKVKINDEAKVEIDANYSFSTKESGEYTLVFSATDGINESTETYTVKLKVTDSLVTYNTIVKVPEEITPEFFITKDFEDNIDILGNPLENEKNDTTDGFTAYTVKVPENVSLISVRGKKSDVSVGGMAVLVSENSEISLREVHVFVPTRENGSYVTKEQVVIDTSDKDGHFATMGECGTDEDGILYYTFLLLASGNDRLYTMYAKPQGELTSKYEVTQADNKAIPKNDASVYETSVTLSYKNAYKLNVPEYAEAKVFFQNKYYNVSELTPLEIKNEDDGTKTYIFSVASGSDAYSFRVSAPGKITKAGYIKETSNKVVWNDSDPAPSDKIEYDITTTLGSRKDDSLLLNINDQNRLILANGSTFKLKAYRTQQIINNDTQNKIIEPDFTYDILSGEDIIDITPINSKNGNAKNNWLNITAKNDGTAILEIGYDAIDIISGNQVGFNAISNFTFSSCDEARKGLIVIQTKNAAEDVDFGIKSVAKWDAEFDTLYFTGENSRIEFSPTVEAGEIKKVEFSNDKGKTWNEITKRGDTYSARIVSGNNILKVTKDDGTESYQVVRGDKVDVSITNLTEENAPLKAGDTVRITLDGVHLPFGKISGVYNPGYSFGHKLTYTLNETTVQAKGTYQYNFPTNAFIDIVIPEDAEPGDSFSLTDGYIYFNNYGATPGSHRVIPEEGLATNMGASEIKYSRCILPDVTISLDNDYISGGDSGDAKDEPSDDTPLHTDGIDLSNLEFDIPKDEVKGYVTITFEDFGERIPDETYVTYKNPLGTIIKEAKVPFLSRDTVASVTLRLLEALKIKSSHTGNESSNFYLSSIEDFTLNEVYYPCFGEFDSGAASGWMITLNNWFINMGASEFFVEDEDIIKWQYTCQRGADIGCDKSEPSAEITGIKFKEDYGTLSPSFDESKTEYTYTVSRTVTSICLEAELENYWSYVTYKAGNKTYKPMESIDVENGTIITISSSFSENAGDTPIDTDSIKITIKKQTVPLPGAGGNGGGITGGGSSSSLTNDEEIDDTADETEKEPLEESSEKKEFSENIFKDVKKDDWHYNSVKYVYENNLMQGTDKGFEPDSKMSRAMLVTVLYRMAKPESTDNTHSFKDVTEGQWYSDAVSWAAANGIVSGISNTEFAPDSDVSREQMALIIYRFAKSQGYDVSEATDISGFEDSESVSDWALDAIKWANKKELINGTSETSLSPKSTATRAQVATILMRFLENIAK